MEYRLLGGSGLRVSALAFGAGAFGGGHWLFDAWGATADVAEAQRRVDICIDAGVNLFDTADIYSDGRSEELLGKALGGKRNQVLVSTKASFRLGDGPNDVGSSRYHLRRSIEGSLRRLGTDHVDMYYMHAFDGITPVEETMETLNSLPLAARRYSSG